jgi:hypothetical protein
VLLGPDSAIVIETGIAPPATPPANDGDFALLVDGAPS